MGDRGGPMYRENKIGVVIPAYNEEGFVADVITSIPEYVDRIYVVDDCSTDGTWEEILSAAHADSQNMGKTQAQISPDGGMVSERGSVHEQIGRVIPIKHHENTGQGGAIKTGYLVALKDDIDIVAKMDADGQMDPDYLPRLLDPIVEGDADYAKGNRLLNRNHRENMPNWRFFGNAILTFLTKIASGYWKMMDPQNGYTAISKKALNNVRIDNMFEYFGYCNDLLVKLNAKGMRVADVAIPAVYEDEESHISYPTYIRRVSGMLLRNFFWRLKVKYLVLDFHPLALFYLFGMGTTGLAMLGGIWSLYVKFILGGNLFIRASLSMLLFLIGVLFIMFAMLFDMQANAEKEVKIYE